MVVGVEVPIGVCPGVRVASALRDADGVGGLKMVGTGVAMVVGVGVMVGLGDCSTGTMRATNASSKAGVRMLPLKHSRSDRKVIRKGVAGQIHVLLGVERDPLREIQIRFLPGRWCRD